MTILIRCGQLFDGTGPSMPDAAIMLEGDRVVSVGPWSPEHRNQRVDDYYDLQEYTVTPGLIEAHGHMGLLGPGLSLSVAEVAGHVFANVRQALEEGFTTVRDAGGIDGGVATCVAGGVIPGPRLLPSGPFITQTGGHGDSRNPWSGAGLTDMPGLVRTAIVSDGVADVRRAVRDAFRRGSTQIKVCVSGGVSSGGDLNICQFSVEELSILVEEARRRNTYVHAHAHTAASIRHGIEAGIRHFEHGSMLDEDTVALMKEVDASLVPTMLIVQRLIEQQTEDVQRKKLEHLLDSMHRSVKAAHDAGVTVGSGSDLLGTNQRGRAQEIVLKAAVLGPVAALISATSANARIIGMANEIGSVRPGLRADLAVFSADPTRDISAVADPSALVAVFQAGHVVVDRIHARSAATSGMPPAAPVPT